MSSAEYNRAYGRRYAARRKTIHTDEWYEHNGTEERKCPQCGATGRLKELYYRCRAAPSGFASPCKNCADKASVVRNYAHRRGITRDESKRLWRLANCACQLCGRQLSEGAFKVDHDHAGGHIRGILCHRCNIVLGLVGDSQPLLRAAIAYIADPPLADADVIRFTPRYTRKIA
jgi:Autographiviridae endonuclease VII